MRCFCVIWSCLFLSWSCLCLVFSSPCPLCVCHLRLVLVSACFLASRLVLSCCVSFLVFVSCCLVLPLPLSLFCLIGVVLVFLLCCAVCLSSWVALSTHFWSFWVVSGVDVGHFGSSWGALGSVLGGLLGVLGGLGGAWNGLESGRRSQANSALNRPRPKIDFGTVLGPQEGAKTAPRRHPEGPRRAKRAPRRSPRRPKIDHKIVF